MKLYKNKQAFTLIELTVIITIMAILVLLAGPRFIGYIEEGRITRIQNDVKVMETIFQEDFALHDLKKFNTFLNNEKDLGELIKDKKLFHIGGLATSLDDIYPSRFTDDYDVGLGGPEIQINNSAINNNSTLLVSKKYKIVPDEYKAKAQTKLQGTFYVNINGKVYYEHDKPMGNNDNNPEEPSINYKTSEVALGHLHSAFITQDKELYTWGNNDFGQLGTGDKQGKLTPTKINIKDKVKSVSLGFSHSAAITENGDLFTWGSGEERQLGHGDTKDKLIPTKVEGISNVKQVELGEFHSAAITENGDLYVWGENDYGKLGLGDTKDRLTPTKVEGIPKVVQVSLGNTHSSAITIDGDLYVWGDGTNGLLGNNNEREQRTPVKLEYFSKNNMKLKSVSFGYTHSAAVTTDGDLYTWGEGIGGKLGHGEENYKFEPTKVNIPVKVKEVVSRAVHTAAISETGDLYVWGDGEYGRLGHGDNKSKFTPTKVNGLSNVKQVALGITHSSAITEDGELYVWGWGELGQLGFGDTKSKFIPTKLIIK